MTPYFYWKKTPLVLNFLKAWDCLVKLGILKPKNRKLRNFFDVVLIGYVQNSNANRYLVINFDCTYVSRNTVIEVRDVTYIESIFPHKIRMQRKPINSYACSSSYNRTCLIILINHEVKEVE